jgi:hypothetical protein
MADKSGKFWVTWANANALSSSKIEDLAEPFRSQATAFIAAMREAGATVGVNVTRRSEKRAYLFHWSWKIALNQGKPSDATPMAGVDIQWDHGNDASSRQGAQEMVTGFGLAVPPRSTKAPGLRSNHIDGEAIDMDITWLGTIQVKNKPGVRTPITFMPDVDANIGLHQLGASYGVLKLVGDAPHWSLNGR